SSDGRVDPADCLFQVSLRCRPVDGHIGRYPSPLRLNSDEEDEELALLYRNVPTYAVGHGAAATWSVRESDGVEYVETTYLPRYAIPAVDFDLPGTGEVLSLAHLAQIAETPERVLPGLRAFVDDYDKWAARLEGMAAGIDQHLI